MSDYDYDGMWMSIRELALEADMDDYYNPRPAIMIGISERAMIDAIHDISYGTAINNPYKRKDYRQRYEDDYSAYYAQYERDGTRLPQAMSTDESEAS